MIQDGFRPHPPAGLILILGTLALVVPVVGQQGQPRTEAERDSLAAAAERAPLFAMTAPLVMTLEADLQDLKRERDEDVEREGVLYLKAPNGADLRLPVKLTTRGVFRLDKRHCNFPPLLLNLPRSQLEGTVFEGQNKLKLLAPCNDTSDEHQQYVLLEYLIYRTYNLLTPVSFRVRLVEITLKDSSGHGPDRTKYAFLIEDVDRLAERHLGEESEWTQFHPLNLESHQATLVDVFEFMIGNTDWSAPYFHNIKMIAQPGPTYLVVPFDFDFSGAVNASYATPDPTLSIRDVRERAYRGFCRPDFDFQTIVELFNDHRNAIYMVVQEFEPLDETERRNLLKYFDSFYEVLNNNGRLEREVIGKCRTIG